MLYTRQKGIYSDHQRARRELSNDDGKHVDVGLMSKTTTLYVHHAFLYMSFPSLHECNVKLLDVGKHRFSRTALSLQGDVTRDDITFTLHANNFIFARL